MLVFSNPQINLQDFALIFGSTAAYKRVSTILESANELRIPLFFRLEAPKEDSVNTLYVYKHALLEKVLVR